MRTTMKYLWNSLWNRKMQTLLVLFSIAASSSLIFANESFQRICEHMFYEADTRYAGTADYMVTPKEKDSAISERDLNMLYDKESYEYVASLIKTDLLYAPSVEDMYYFHVYATDLEEFMKYNPFALIEGSFEEFSGYKIIVGSAYAEIYNLHTGDTMELEINELTYPFVIAGIAEEKGIFLRELADGGTIIMPKETLTSISNLSPNLVYIKEKGDVDLIRGLESLKTLIPTLDVELTVDEVLIEAETSTNVMPFRISAFAVIFMSIFIIYSGFSLIAEDRIFCLGIIRNLGMTKKKMNLLLLIESVFIGVIGGISGCILGVFILKLIKTLYFSHPDNYSTNVPMLFGIKEIVYTIVVAIVITILSAMIPIVKTSKKSLKDIMIHRPEKKKNLNSKVWILGLVFLSTSIILSQQPMVNLVGTIRSFISVTFALFGMILLVPNLALLISYCFHKLNLPREIIIGARNVTDNPVLSKNLRLFAGIIAIVAFMSSIFASLSYDLHDAYKTKYLYDITMELKEPSVDESDRMLSIDGVTSVAPYQSDYETVEVNKGVFINSLFGIKDINFFNYNAVLGLDTCKDAINHLNDGNNIITTTIMHSKFGYNIGDTMTLKSKNNEMTFTITGFVDTNSGIGHIAYISQDNFEGIMKSQGYTHYAVKGNLPEQQLKNNIKREFSKQILSITTNQEQEHANSDKVDSIFNSINCYTYIAVLVGIIGIMNNIIGGYLERKRSLALYRCIGMSRAGISKMIITEAMIVGLLGIGFGIFTAFIMMKNIPGLVGLMWGSVVIHPANFVILMLSLSGVLIMFAISIIPLKVSQKINIIESIRYEA